MKHSLLISFAVFAAVTTGFTQAGVDPAVPGAPDEPPRSSSRSRRSPTPSGVAGSASGQFSFSAMLSGKPSRGDSVPPVVIRFSESDPKANAELEQDLYVMARVLSRMLERADNPHIEYKMNVPMVLTGAGKSVRPMYIEGVGPLFMIKVNFPVMMAPKTAPGKTEPVATDSEWHEAEKDLFGQNVEFSSDDIADGDYSEEKVAMLKREIITAIKNATKIRSLKPEEYMNIAVFGQASSPSRKGDSSSASKGTVLTMRVRKSEIDAFAADKLTVEAFTAKVSTTTYVGSGAGMTSVNSWLLDGLKNNSMR